MRGDLIRVVMVCQASLLTIDTWQRTYHEVYFHNAGCPMRIEGVTIVDSSEKNLLIITLQWEHSVYVWIIHWYMDNKSLFFNIISFYVNTLNSVWFGLVWFLCLMAYQPSWIILCKTKHSYICTRLVGLLVDWILWNICLCRLFKAESIFIQTISSVSNNSV